MLYAGKRGSNTVVQRQRIRSENKKQQQNRNHYTISTRGDEKVSQTIKHLKEAAEIFEDAHILEVNKIHEVSLNNNKGTDILTLKSNATNVVTCLDKTIYNHVPQRIKFV